MVQVLDVKMSCVEVRCIAVPAGLRLNSVLGPHRKPFDVFLETAAS